MLQISQLFIDKLTINSWIYGSKTECANIVVPRVNPKIKKKVESESGNEYGDDDRNLMHNAAKIQTNQTGKYEVENKREMNE